VVLLCAITDPPTRSASAAAAHPIRTDFQFLICFSYQINV
jgi:hypothetical protein